MKQKSKAQWIKLGESNTKYFLAIVKDRTQRKNITELTSLAGDLLIDAKAIKEEIMSFYKGLIGSVAHSLPAK